MKIHSPAGGKPLSSYARRARRRVLPWAVAVPLLSGLAAVPFAHAVETPALAAITAPAGAAQKLTNPADAMDVMARLLEQNANHIALRVDNLPITQADAADYIRAMPASMAGLGMDGIFKHAMDALIRQKAMAVQARKQGLDKDPGVIRKSDILFEKVLVDAWLHDKAGAAVSERKLRARYDQDIAGKPGPAEVRARVILVATEAEAQALIRDATGKGADGFGDLARKNSKGPGAEQGGDLGYVTLEAVPPEVGGVMFSLSPGQMTAYPIRAAGGFYIVRVEGRKDRATPGFEEARPMLERAERAEAVRLAVMSVTDTVKIAMPAGVDEKGPAIKR